MARKKSILLLKKFYNHQNLVSTETGIAKLPMFSEIENIGELNRLPGAIRTAKHFSRDVFEECENRQVPAEKGAKHICKRKNKVSDQSHCSL
jgi:hypothetical protein